MPFYSEIFSRLISKTPPFFKKIRALGLCISGICGPVVAIPTTYTGAVISDSILKICSHLLVAGVIMTSVAQLTKDNNATIDTK